MSKQEIKTLGLTNDQTAKDLLNTAILRSKICMKKRGWVVSIIEEFYPSQANLLGININMGEKIKIRLRQPSNIEQFLPPEDILGTLLHELCHIVHGPHDAIFNKLLDQLWDEVENGEDDSNTIHLPTKSNLVSNSTTLTGSCQRLGGHRLSEFDAKKKAVHMASLRAMKSGGKLGGETHYANLSPAEACRRATLKRMRQIGSERGCQLEHDS